MFVVFVFVRIERVGCGIYSKQRRHRQWCVLRKRVTGSGTFSKDTTGSGAFETRPHSAYHQLKFAREHRPHQTRPRHGPTKVITKQAAKTNQRQQYRKFQGQGSDLQVKTTTSIGPGVL
jgi:hypothetical protein